MKTLVTTPAGRLEIVEVDRPRPAAHEVMVRVALATINPVDAMVLAGTFHEMGLVTHDRPLGLGWDLVGTVAAVGEDVTGLRQGQLVAAVRTGFDVAVGTMSEYLALPASDVALVPDGLHAEQAAGVGMNALTAAQALAMLGADAGRSLLVTGAAGSVGGFAIELATAAGWDVTGLARDSDRAFVERSGARLVTALDETTYDAVLDAVPLQSDEATFASSVVPAVRSGGAFISVLGAFPLPEMPGREVAAVLVTPSGATLAELLEAAVDGTVTPRVAGTLPLDQAAEAFDLAARPGGRGRWLLAPGSLDS